MRIKILLVRLRKSYIRIDRKIFVKSFENIVRNFFHLRDFQLIVELPLLGAKRQLEIEFILLFPIAHMAPLMSSAHLHFFPFTAKAEDG